MTPNFSQGRLIRGLWPWHQSAVCPSSPTIDAKIVPVVQGLDGDRAEGQEDQQVDEGDWLENGSKNEMKWAIVERHI